MKLKNKEEENLYKVLILIRAYSINMDGVFSDIKNREKYSEIYTSYKVFSDELIKIFADLGVFQNGK